MAGPQGRANTIAAIMGLNTFNTVANNVNRDAQYSKYLDRLDEQGLLQEIQSAGFNQTQAPESVTIGRSPLGSLLASVGVLDKTRPLNEREKAAYKTGQLKEQDVEYTQSRRKQLEEDKRQVDLMRKLQGTAAIYNLVGATENPEEGASYAQQLGIPIDTQSLVNITERKQSERQARQDRLQELISGAGKTPRMSETIKDLKAISGFDVKMKRLKDFDKQIEQLKDPLTKMAPDVREKTINDTMFKADRYYQSIAQDLMDAGRENGVVVTPDLARRISGYDPNRYPFKYTKVSSPTQDNGAGAESVLNLGSSLAGGLDSIMGGLGNAASGAASLYNSYGNPNEPDYTNQGGMQREQLTNMFNQGLK